MPPAPNPHQTSHDDTASQSPDNNHSGTSSRDSESDAGSGPARVFVEHYPNERAGAPIDTEPLEEFDLAAYIGSCGPFADPKVFRAAELLIAGNLTNNQRTEFLQSEVVSNLVTQ